MSLVQSQISISNTQDSVVDPSHTLESNGVDTLSLFLQNITKPVKNIAESWDMDISDILEKYSERIRLIHEANEEFDFVEGM